MRRYLKVLLTFWRASLAAEVEYRTNFLLALLSASGGLVGALFSLSLFFQRGHTFDGWSYDESLVVLGIFTSLQGLTQTLLVPNLSAIVTLVETGNLDFTLLKPIDSQFQVSLRRISPWGVPDIFFGVGVLLWACLRLQVQAQQVVFALLPLTLGALTLYGMWFMLATTAIWFVKTYNATAVLQGLLDAGRFPISAFPAGLRVFFTVVVPVAFLTTFPAEVILGRRAPTSVLLAAAIALGLLMASRLFWKFALRSYTSASS